MARAALLVGATGLVGGHVLDRLLLDSRWSRVVVLARRAVGRKDAKLSEQIVDFAALPSSGAATGEGGVLDGIDDVFACLGTTIKVAGSKERFREVDHDFTVAVARLAREAGATRIALVSSVGADASASTFYLRVKGETERDVGALGYDQTVIARPSVLVGERNERRPGESAGIAVTSVLAPLMVGALRAYRPIDAKVVAAAMVEAIVSGEKGTRILLHAELLRLATNA